MKNKESVYIIAEAGVNHCGSIDLAIQMIDEAKKCGVDCIKFQTFKAAQIVSANSPKANYQLKVTSKEESQLDMLKKLELDYSDYLVLMKRCHDNGIDFLSTPYNFEDVDFLISLGVDGFKIASGQLTELPFLKYAAKHHKKMIISTGMANMAEVFMAVEAIREMGNNNIAVLQCTTNYPSKIEEANLLAMGSIKAACNVDVGYSDHTENNHACFAAVALGSNIIEKHFTLDKTFDGPDHSSSSSPDELKELVFGIREIEKALGTSVKSPTESERANIYGMKRSMVALMNLKEGTVLERKHIGFKRPANGLSPNLYENILGKKVCKELAADEAFQFNHINW
jgi:N,N'-diacetyllegionaminate synthase